jgi:hypothetical protein
VRALARGRGTFRDRLPSQKGESRHRRAALHENVDASGSEADGAVRAGLDSALGALEARPRPRRARR